MGLHQYSPHDSFTPCARCRSSVRETRDADESGLLPNTPAGPAERARNAVEESRVRIKPRPMSGELSSETQAMLVGATRDADKDGEGVERHNRDRSSVVGDVTPRSDGYHFSEPPSSPTIYIRSTSDDPFRPPYVSISPNSFLESVQPRCPGNTDEIPKPPEQLATPVPEALGDLGRA